MKSINYLSDRQENVTESIQKRPHKKRKNIKTFSGPITLHVTIYIVMDIFCFVFVQKNPFSQKTIVALSKKEMIDDRQRACVGAHQAPGVVWSIL
jgi:hypothetical protein